jgi:hypothetical protein
VVTLQVSRDQVLAYRVHAHQLDRQVDVAGGQAVTDADVLDLGVQDTGADGALWSLANRGVEVTSAWPDDLTLVWTLRGAPHAYRRTDLAAVATATAPLSEADAGRRIFDAARPLRAAGLPVLHALATVSREMRALVEAPTVKGDVSGALTYRLDEPFRRWCGPCGIVHLYEMPFRLAALPAGIELTPGTSPPVLRRAPAWTGPAADVPPRLDPVRAFLHLNGPATQQHVAAYLDAPVAEVKAHWPQDAVPVTVAAEAGRRWVLEDDAAALGATSSPASSGSSSVRLLSPFDPLLQTKDRELLVPDPSRRKELWRAIGRPGAVLAGHEVVGTWRPRASGRRLHLTVDRWTTASSLTDEALTEQAERLAAHRGLSFAGW